MTRVVVTGAGGFVGRHIVQAALAAGWRVAAVDTRLDADLTSVWADRDVELFEGPVEGLPAFEADYAIHGAAITARPEDRGETPEANLRANLNSLLALLEWTQANGVRRTLVISSSAVFRGSSERLLTEDSPATALGLYAVAKRTAEDLVRTLHAEYGRDIAAVRLGSVYGPGEQRRPTRPRLSAVGELIEQAITTGRVRIPRSSPAVDWTYAGSVGRAMVALLQAATLHHPVYHLTCGEALTHRDLAEAIQRQIPEVTIDVAADDARPFRGAMASSYLEADTGFRDWTPLTEGLSATVAWFRQSTALAGERVR